MISYYKSHRIKSSSELKLNSEITIDSIPCKIVIIEGFKHGYYWYVVTEKYATIEQENTIESLRQENEMLKDKIRNMEYVEKILKESYKVKL